MASMNGLSVNMGVADQSPDETDDLAVGISPTASPEDKLAFIQGSLKRAYDYREKADRATEALRTQRAPNQTANTLLAIGSSLLSPTRTGSFGETLGNVGQTVGAINAQHEKDDYDRRQSETEALVKRYDKQADNQEAVSAKWYQQMLNMDKETRAQKEAASAHAGAWAFGLRQRIPYEQRKTMIAQNAPALKAAGLTDNEIAEFDPTDTNLDGLLARMQTIDQAFKYADQEKDNARAQAEADERARHDKEMEAIGRGNMGANITRANKPAASAASGLPSGYRVVTP